MELMGLILALSALLWYVIETHKHFWKNWRCKSLITTVIAAAGAFSLVFNFNLDIVYALHLTNYSCTAGQIVTGFVMMSGSSAISDVASKIKSNKI